MRIKKVAPTTSIQAQVVNTYSNSDSDTYSCDYINNSDSYSTNEIKTNKRWIDGKPIYRKIFNNVSISAGTGRYITSGISNIENMIKLEGILRYSGNNQFITIPSYYNSSIFISANYQYNENRIYYDCGTFSGTAIFILEYTKTTDNTNTRNLQESKKSASEDEVKEPIEEPIEDEKK